MSPSARAAIEAFAMFFGLCGSGLYMIVTQSRAMDALRTRHPELWVSLGRPSIIPIGNGAGDFGERREATAKALSFLWSGKYRALNDPVLSRLGLQTKISVCLMPAVLVALFILVNVLESQAPVR